MTGVVRYGALLAAVLMSEAAPALSAQPPASRFRVYDMLIYKHKPDLTDLGMLPMLELGGNLWSAGAPLDQIDEPAFTRTIRSIYNYSGLVYLDIESWPICNEPPAVRRANIAKFLRAIQLVREEGPGLRVGLYSVVPAAEYAAFVRNDSARLTAWNACNVLLEPIAAKVDFIMPSVYAYYDDADAWEVYATALIRGARRYGKPVYPFLWPEYHESNERLRHTSLPGPYWKRQLQVVRREADGVVLWNAWRREWDPTAPWWLETEAFLRGL